MTLKILAASIIALLVGSLFETADADQSFLCDDGTLLQVAAKDIEKMRVQNTCVAKYLGTAPASTRMTFQDTRAIRKPATPAAPKDMRLKPAEPTNVSHPKGARRAVRILNAHHHQ